MMNLKLSKKQVVSQYDQLARSGKFPDNTPLHQTLLKLIAPHFRNPDSLEILDAGSGAGYFGLEFAKFGHRVTLMDLSFEALSTASERCSEMEFGKQVETVVGDVESVPFENESFDAITCIFVFSHLNDPIRAMAGLSRVLRKGGWLIIGFESRMWHVISAGLCEKYDEAVSLMSSEKPIVKAYDILPPVRLYSIPEIENLCEQSDLRITSFTGVRHLTSFQEPLKGIGTIETEKLMLSNPKACELENRLVESRELLCLARHFLIECERKTG